MENNSKETENPSTLKALIIAFIVALGFGAAVLIVSGFTSWTCYLAFPVAAAAFFATFWYVLH